MNRLLILFYYNKETNTGYYTTSIINISLLDKYQHIELDKYCSTSSSNNNFNESINSQDDSLLKDNQKIVQLSYHKVYINSVNEFYSYITKISSSRSSSSSSCNTGSILSKFNEKYFFSFLKESIVILFPLNNLYKDIISIVDIEFYKRIYYSQSNSSNSTDSNNIDNLVIPLSVQNVSFDKNTYLFYYDHIQLI